MLSPSFTPSCTIFLVFGIFIFLSIFRVDYISLFTSWCPVLQYRFKNLSHHVLPAMWQLLPTTPIIRFKVRLLMILDTSPDTELSPSHFIICSLKNPFLTSSPLQHLLSWVARKGTAISATTSLSTARRFLSRTLFADFCPVYCMDQSMILTHCVHKFGSEESYQYVATLFRWCSSPCLMELTGFELAMQLFMDLWNGKPLLSVTQ